MESLEEVIERGRTRYGFSFLFCLKACKDKSEIWFRLPNIIRKFYISYYEINKKGEINMDVINVSEIHDEVTLELTKRTDEILHMILDLKQDKEVDLYRLQTLVLNEYKDIIDLLHIVEGLQHELENRKRKIIEIPKFMSSKETQ